MSIILREDLPKKLVFGMVNGLDDILVVAREVEEAPTFARGAEFGQNVFAGKGHQIIGGIETELGAQVSKDPRCIVLELEIVFRGGDQFVSSTANVSHVQVNTEQTTYMSKENLCLASKSAAVSSRSILALILETVKRIPVNMLYAVT